MKLIATQEDRGKRLDKFLADNIDESRSQIKKLIEAEIILVNNKPSTVHYFLKPDDKITEAKEKIVEIKKEEKQQEKFDKTLEPKIIYDCSDFVIVEKPAGLLVHPTDKDEKYTLVSWLTKKFKKIKNVGEQKYRAGIIHRLDRDVSGVMVVAKTNEFYHHIKEQFKKRKINKQYLALVYGRIEKDQDEIDLPIGRSKKTGQFVAHPRKGKEKFDEDDKTARTKFKVIERVKDYSLLDIKILTGRTHQIRAHLYGIGSPILGDQIYKPKREIFNFLRKRIKVVDPGRIFLHSHKIGFRDLSGQWQEFDSPLPKKLNDYLNEIRR